MQDLPRYFGACEKNIRKVYSLCKRDTGGMGRRACMVGVIIFSIPIFVSALESPQPVGYTCASSGGDAVEGGYYYPQADPCGYLSPTLSGFRYGDMNRGTVGSSTRIVGHSLGNTASGYEFNEPNYLKNVLKIQNGEDLFVAIYIVRNISNDIDNFRAYFTIGGSPPHQNYGFIRFKYGVAPPAINFSVASTTLEEGQTSTLEWHVANATSCSASEGWLGPRPLSGSESIAPATTTEYVLVCSGAGGTATSSVSVVVLPPDEPDPVIIIPGILGSEKNSDGEWVIDPILHTYDDLIATLDVNHYTPDDDLFTFPYNWRKSNVETAVLLKQKIDEVKAICGCEKVDLVAHSMGGLVARQYIQSDAYGQDVDQLIFLGTPHLGAPKAYLMWEGGEIAAADDFSDEILERLLEHEAYEHGHIKLFDYIHNEPIHSVHELLPVYDYIFDGSTLRHYPNNYPSNPFLESLNENVTSLLNSGVEIHNIIGETGMQETISGIQATNAGGYAPQWPHGYPEGFYDLFGSHGLIRSSGDKTVPLVSSSFVNVNVEIKSAIHNLLPFVAQSEIFSILTSHEPNFVSTEYSGIDLKSLLLIKIFSPADLLVIAPDGKKIGKENGQVVNQFSDAFYSGFNTNTEYITILNPLDGEYKVITQGTGGGAYTVETNYISEATTTTSSFTGATNIGLLTELELNVDNANPENLEITPSDVEPPVIAVSSPAEQDYPRSEQLSVNVSAIDIETGVLALETWLDGTSIPNTGSIDLFYQSLGTHLILASSTDNVGNATTSERLFRIIATPDSTLSDIERAYMLGWMTKGVRDGLIKKLKAAIKISQYVERRSDGKPNAVIIQKRVDKLLAAAMLIELHKLRGKGLNEQAFQLLKEDIQWLIAN